MAVIGLTFTLLLIASARVTMHSAAACTATTCGHTTTPPHHQPNKRDDTGNGKNCLPIHEWPPSLLITDETGAAQRITLRHFFLDGSFSFLPDLPCIMAPIISIVFIHMFM